MKKTLEFLFLFLLFPLLGISQDTLLTVNGEEKYGKVLEIKVNEILVKKDSVNYVYAKKDIFMIKFANGTKEVFKENLNNSFEKAIELSQEQKTSYGIQDGLKFYDDDMPLYVTGGVCCATGVLGLIPLIYYHSQPPLPTLTKTSHPELLKDATYVKSFGKAAKEIRKKKAVKGALIAAIPYTIYVGFMIALAGGFGF